ncbi:M24 family metallopeptidase [Hyalangium sp.]|uniref:M24 family metallopeptidase n=1 Tax=Hyalangium sp. TaxID=2028555 RepID=UPI002D3F00E6|nr:M24 family metallopeptidase [Hyalangium sp.]HYH98898.1 M24 family metallopeptidase [Hyalangium sp.]
MRTSLHVLFLASLLLSTACATLGAQPPHSERAGPQRPFGTLRQQVDRQQAWLKERLEVALPKLMRQHGVELWVVAMREYNEDPVFKALVSGRTFAARRRTLFVFHDMGPDKGVVRLTLGGGAQGGLYEPRRMAREVDGGGTVRTAEPWGPEQWQMLKQVLEERQPKSVAINVSRTFAFADGLTHGEYEGMTEALGPEWTARLKPSGGLPVDLLAWRSGDEERFFAEENKLAWDIIGTAFSNTVITPGVTRVNDVEWWMSQRLNDLGLETWFHPMVSVQRQGATEQQLGEDPIIQRGDVLHCDFGITALRLNTDTQHMGYVLREGETDVPAGLKQALARSNRLQDLVVEELRPGRTGNEVLRTVLGRMKQEGIDGTVYSHPVGLNGHGAGAIIGLWDRQEGVPGNGDHTIIPSMWYSVELQATSPVPEWGGQRVRSAQEEDVIIDASGRVRWAWQRQTGFHLVR